MATNTLYSTYCRSGYLSSDGYSYTSNWTIGLQSGHNYRSVVQFPDLLLRDSVIQSIKFLINRIDTYGGRTTQMGFNQSTAWGSAILQSFSVGISSGTGVKTIDLTPYISLIQGFVGSWCIHTNRDGNADFCQFNGDEDGTSGPRIVVTYENAVVEYYTSGAWQKALVYYRDSTGAWKQCIPYMYVNGAWVRV